MEGSFPPLFYGPFRVKNAVEIWHLIHIAPAYVEVTANFCSMVINLDPVDFLFFNFGQKPVQSEAY